MTGDPAAPVLVTGATGFVGSHLVDRLVQMSVPVRCLVRRSSSLRYLPQSGIDIVFGELPDGTGLTAALEGVRTVFHVAGVTKAHSAAAFYRGNVDVTRRLIDACGPAGVERFVHVSSLAAIGPCADASGIAEDAAPHPLTHYGRSKLAGERVVVDSPMASRAVIVRPAVVYGPRDTDVYEVFRAAARGLLVTIGREESLASVIYVKDLVEALLRAACSAGAPGRAYFAANPTPASWAELAGAAAAVMGRGLRRISVPPAVAWAAGLCAELASRARRKPGIVSREKIREARCRYWVCDTSRARHELGFTPQWTLARGVAETLAWYRDAGWLSY